jgi:hypothetical protein
MRNKKKNKFFFLMPGDKMKREEIIMKEHYN